MNDKLESAIKSVLDKLRNLSDEELHSIIDQYKMSIEDDEELMSYD